MRLKHMIFAAMLACPAAMARSGAGPAEQEVYALGPGDVIQVSVLDMEEIGRHPSRIDMRGNINLPVVGRVAAAGLTADQLGARIEERLRSHLRQPDVTISVVEMRSQPVSVLGAVAQPGVQQVQGRKTLMEVISQAGGLRQDAGYAIRIARLKQWGRLPLPTAREDESGQYWLAELAVAEAVGGQTPASNIEVRPNDVITVPKGKVVYVMGAVRKSGGFVLGERERITVLEALSMAEGADAFAKKSSVKILRKSRQLEKRDEIAVDLGRILDGRAPDQALEAEDILYVPVSGGKKAVARTTEALVQITTGLIVWRR